MLVPPLMSASVSAAYATAQAGQRTRMPLQAVSAGTMLIADDRYQPRRQAPVHTPAQSPARPDGLTGRASRIEAPDAARRGDSGYSTPRQHAVSLFVAQRFAQEEAPDPKPGMQHAAGAAAYPSLGFDDDILLPGETVAYDFAGGPRLDILV